MDIFELPKYHELMKPTLIALDKIGGSASLNEINDAVIELAGLPAPALDVQYESGAGAVLTDRLSWARSHLKEGGFLASGGVESGCLPTRGARPRIGRPTLCGAKLRQRSKPSMGTGRNR